VAKAQSGSSFILRLVILCCCLLLGCTVRATTWNEPWHEEVMGTSDSFVKVRITEVEGSSCKAEVLKFLGGMKLPQQIDLAGYSILNLTSTSSFADELRSPFRAGDICYVFLKKDLKTNKYQIPTPTSGWARLDQGTVAATYRHSYHKALVPEDIYEQTMQAIFNGIKGQPYDGEFIASFLKQQLSMSVAALTDTDPAMNKRFFLQHAALESFYYLRKGVDLSVLIPFVHSDNYHVQISACRAVSAIDSPASRELLMKFIESKGTGFAKVMCVWGLKRLKAKDMIPRLQAYLKNGDDQETGFGGNIMDPRVGTFFPDSVKASVRILLGEWGQPVSKPESSLSSQRSGYAFR
jgi:hypothetical protein